MPEYIWALLIAAVVGILLQKLHFPGGMLVGAIIGMAAFSILIDPVHLPRNVKLLAQIMAGIFVGSGVQKKDVIHMPRLAGPISILLVTLTLFSIFMGLLLPYLGYMDMMTGMMCAVPGGMSDTPIIAAAFGADVPTVTVVQFARLLSGIAIFPVLITSFVRRFVHQEVAIAPSQETDKAVPPSAPLSKILCTVLIGAIFGLLGDALSIPAGGLVFSMAAVIVQKMRGLEFKLPIWFRRIAQVLSGAYIGTSFTLENIYALRHLGIPICIILLGYLIISILLGYLFRRLWGMSQGEAMLACTPAGASDMALIASDLGVTSADLVIIQVARFVYAVGCLPPILLFVATLLGK